MNNDCQNSPTRDAYGGDANILNEFCANALPNTGLDLWVLVLIAAILVGTGLYMRWATRRD